MGYELIWHLDIVATFRHHVGWWLVDVSVGWFDIFRHQQYAQTDHYHLVAASNSVDPWSIYIDYQWSHGLPRYCAGSKRFHHIW